MGGSKTHYFIYTGKYSPKSYVVNFRTQFVVANQRSKRWFSHVKKMIRPIRIANDVFFTHFTLHQFFLMYITTQNIFLIPDDDVARNLIIIFNFSS